MSDVMPGAEAWSHAGDRRGALVLHGFTGNPSSVRGVAEALAAAGFTVELPRLPGHGTKVADMIPTRWADWSGAVERAYTDLAARVDRMVIAGLSMGGTLTLWLAARHQVAGIVCINAATQPQPPEVIAAIQGMLDGGTELMPGIGSDIADPDAIETAYPETPVAPLLSLMEALTELGPMLASVSCPVLVMTSPQDHVVTPEQSDFLAASVSGPVERVSLERSYHVATLDYDRAEIERRAVQFALKVTAG